jgi:hypothetical protein
MDLQVAYVPIAVETDSEHFEVFRAVDSWLSEE